MCLLLSQCCHSGAARGVGVSPTKSVLSHCIIAVLLEVVGVSPIKSVLSQRCC